MNKREAAKRQKIETEKAALLADLMMLAVGAGGSLNVEDDPDNGVGIYNTLGCEGWSRWIQAIEAWWQIGVKYEDADGNTSRRRPWVNASHNLHKFESVEKACEHLYNSGARAGGGWND